MVRTSEETTKNTSEDRHWRWYHLGEDEKQDQGRDGCTVPTKTIEDDVHDRIGWRKSMSAAGTPQLSRSDQRKKTKIRIQLQ